MRQLQFHVILLLTACAMLAIGSVARAGTVTTEAVADHYGKIDDASNVQGGNGDAETLLIKNATANSRKAWVRFDLTGVDIGMTHSATFRFRQADISTSYTGTFGIWGLNAGFTPSGGVLDVDWDEDALTWNNAPGNNTASKNNFAASATKIGTINFNTGTENTGFIYSIILPNLSDFYQSSNSSVTLMISVDTQSNQSPGFNIASSESTTDIGPELIVKLVPEPTTLSLAGLAACGLLVRRGRR